MDAVRSGSARYVETIVDEHACRRTARDADGTLRKFVKNSRRQCLLAYLNEGNSRGYDCFDEPQYVRELGIVRSCSGCRRSGRYRAGDWKLERHRWICSGVARSVAEERLRSG